MLGAAPRLSPMEILGIGIARAGGSDNIALEELIFTATQRALVDAAVSIDEVTSVVIAASDLYDGRAITTMTLSDAAGSVSREEVRVCDDAIAAFETAGFHLATGGECSIVVSWSNASAIGSPDELEKVGLDFFTLRPVASPIVLEALGDSAFEKRATRPGKRERRFDKNVVFATVVKQVVEGEVGNPRIESFGSFTGSYGDPKTPRGISLGSAASLALEGASVTAASLQGVFVGSTTASDATIRSTAGIPDTTPIHRPRSENFLGYAAGHSALVDAIGLLVGGAAPTAGGRMGLIVSCSGVSDQTGRAMVVRLAS